MAADGKLKSMMQALASRLKQELKLPILSHKIKISA